MAGTSRLREADRALGQIARGQHGVVARRQLRAIGLADHAIHQRVASGRLHAIHAGVYAVGHSRLTQKGRWSAAVLGSRGTLSHWSAGELPGVIEARGRAIHVSGDATNGTLDGVHRHRVSLVPEEITVHDGIPTTTVERTLLDLAPLTSTPRLRRMADQAQILGLLDLTALRSVVRRRAGHRGIRALREVLDDMGAPEVTRSELEDRFLAFCAERAIPAPTMNVAVELAGRHFVLDAVWGAAQVCVELDGWQSHGTRLSFESDRDRDRRLTAAGWRVVRITWRQLHSESDRVAADLRAVLRGRRGPDSAVIGQEIRYSLWSDW